MTPFQVRPKFWIELQSFHFSMFNLWNFRLWLIHRSSTGKILLDGHDIKNLQLKWLREQMGLVSQEPALFDTTLAGNILLGKEDADMEQVIVAAKAANAHSFIEELPDSYNTQVCPPNRPCIVQETETINSGPPFVMT